MPFQPEEEKVILNSKTVYFSTLDPNFSSLRGRGYLTKEKQSESDLRLRKSKATRKKSTNLSDSNSHHLTEYFTAAKKRRYKMNLKRPPISSTVTTTTTVTNSILTTPPDPSMAEPTTTALSNPSTTEVPLLIPSNPPTTEIDVAASLAPLTTEMASVTISSPVPNPPIALTADSETIATVPVHDKATDPAYRLMPYRRSGIQYNEQHYLDPQSPQDPIMSATSTPYMSSSPVYICFNRELVSASVGSDGPMTPLTLGSSLLNTPASDPPPLLSPLLLPSPEFPRRLREDGQLAVSIQDAVDFLNRNGYSCRPANSTASTVQSNISSFLTSRKDNPSTPSDSGSRQSSVNGRRPGPYRRSDDRRQQKKSSSSSEKSRQQKIPIRNRRSKKNKTIVSCTNVSRLTVNIGTI